MAKGKLRKKKTWHKGRFYHDMTDFYASSNRQRMWTKPTVELRPGMIGGGSMILKPLGSMYQDGGSSSPLGSPTRKSAGGGRLGRTGTFGSQGNADSPSRRARQAPSLAPEIGSGGRRLLRLEARAGTRLGIATLQATLG